MTDTSDHLAQVEAVDSATSHLALLGREAVKSPPPWEESQSRPDGRAQIRHWEIPPWDRHLLVKLKWLDWLPRSHDKWPPLPVPHPLDLKNDPHHLAHES